MTNPGTSLERANKFAFLAIICLLLGGTLAFSPELSTLSVVGLLGGFALTIKAMIILVKWLIQFRG